MKETLIIRSATENDAEDILRIYSYYVMNTVITFEYTVPSLDDFRERIRNIISVYPFLVCLVNGRIAGYAYASPHMERAAYHWNAVLSVYHENKYTGQGIGSILYETLMDILKKQHVQNVYGIVTYPNIPSEKLHLKTGFTPVGIFHHTGFKYNRWHDVIWYEKFIGDNEKEPEPLVAYPHVEGNLLKVVLENN